MCYFFSQVLETPPQKMKLPTNDYSLFQELFLDKYSKFVQYFLAKTTQGSTYCTGL